MKIVVIGGSGLIGAKLVERLRRAGHEVVAASRATGVNTITGEGLAEAMKGAQVVVDVANAPSWEDQAVLEFFETSGRNMLAAEEAAGVKHHVALSVVGTDRMLASGYFRAKMAQEKLIKAAKIPYTIVRATQFFEFVGAIAGSGADGRDSSAAAGHDAARRVGRRGGDTGRRRRRGTAEWDRRFRRAGTNTDGRTCATIPGGEVRSAESRHRQAGPLFRHAGGRSQPHSRWRRPAGPNAVRRMARPHQLMFGGR